MNRWPAALQILTGSGLWLIQWVHADCGDWLLSFKGTVLLKLRLLTGPRAGRQHRISDTKPVSIGRRTGRLRLHDSRVSKNHAQISFEKGVWVLRDFDSANGTFVNRDRVQGLVQLERGDLIQIGRVLIKVRSADDVGMDLVDDLLPTDDISAALAQDTAEEDSAGLLGDDIDIQAMLSELDGGTADPDDSDHEGFDLSERTDAPPEADKADADRGSDSDVDDLSIGLAGEPETDDAPSDDPSDDLLVGVDEALAEDTGGDLISLKDEDHRKSGPGTTILTAMDQDKGPDQDQDENVAFAQDGDLQQSSSDESDIFDQGASGQVELDEELDAEVLAEELAPAEEDAEEDIDAGVAADLELEAGLEDDQDEVDTETPLIVGLHLDQRPPQQPEPAATAEEPAALAQEPIEEPLEELVAESADELDESPGADAIDSLADDPAVENVPETVGLDTDSDLKEENTARYELAAEAEPVFEPEELAPELAEAVDADDVDAEDDGDAALALDAEPELDVVAEAEAEPEIESEPEPEPKSVFEIDAADALANPDTHDAGDMPEFDIDAAFDALSEGLDDTFVGPALSDALSDSGDVTDDARDASGEGEPVAASQLDSEPDPKSEVEAKADPESIVEAEAELDPSSEPDAEAPPNTLEGSQLDVGFIKEALDRLAADDDSDADVPETVGEGNEEALASTDDGQGDDDLLDALNQASVDADTDLADPFAKFDEFDDEDEFDGLGELEALDSSGQDEDEPSFFSPDELDADPAEVAWSDAAEDPDAQDVAAEADHEAQPVSDSIGTQDEDSRDEVGIGAERPAASKTQTPPPGLNPTSVLPPDEPYVARGSSSKPSKRKRWFFRSVIFLAFAGTVGWFVIEALQPDLITGRTPSSSDGKNDANQAGIGLPKNGSDNSGTNGQSNTPRDESPGTTGGTTAESAQPRIADPSAPDPFAEGPGIIGSDAVAGIITSGPKSSDRSDPASETGVRQPKDPDATVVNPGTSDPGVGTPNVVPVAVQPSRIIFLVDASGSMVDTLPQMLVWMNEAVQTVQPNEQFAVIFFKAGQAIETEPTGLQAPTEEVLAKIGKKWLNSEAMPVFPAGRSNPTTALKRAISLNPTDIYLLSDKSFGRYAGDTTPQQAVDLVKQVVGKSDVRLHGVQFFYRDEQSALETLATQYKGTFEFVKEDVVPGSDPIDLLEELGGEGESNVSTKDTSEEDISEDIASDRLDAE